MEIARLISINPDIHHGTPVITGTRVPVSIIVGSLAGGMSKEDVCTEYGVSKDAIDAALEYAAELIRVTEATSLASD
ncbi:MAG TPA: DUF433 domain-containing protein [Blastocatellia bacterium]|nr:DUF433 domain-containing protein [Blastocatellia bacterium]